MFIKKSVNIAEVRRGRGGYRSARTDRQNVHTFKEEKNPYETMKNLHLKGLFYKKICKYCRGTAGERRLQNTDLPGQTDRTYSHLS